MNKVTLNKEIKVIGAALVMTAISVATLQFISLLGFIILFGWFAAMFSAIVVMHDDLQKKDIVDGNTSDGYHTFDELYYHRMVLFSVICNTYKDLAWKSWKHADGTMFDDYFIVGIYTPEGDYTYHYHKDYWNMFYVNEINNAPKWDGHKPEDITRLNSLLDLINVGG